MTSFEDLVRENTITAKGLRPEWAGHVIAALRHADAYGRGAGHLTEAERSVLYCIDLMVQGRLGESEGFDREYTGATGLVGWTLQIVLDNAKIAEIDPGLLELVSQFQRDLSDHYGARTEPGPPAGETPAGD